MTLSDPERQFYKQLLLKSQSIFEGFIIAGTATKSWFAIFSLLSRLRMACDHIALTVKSQIDEEGWNLTKNGVGSSKVSPSPRKDAATGKDTVDESVRFNFLLLPYGQTGTAHKRIDPKMLTR